jgi:regulator of protease activity HflC (stomatin/prohibitin superfamily)
MNPAQIERLLAGLPADVDERHRRLVDGYAATARRCNERITARRAELERALRSVGEAAAAGSPVEAADEAIRLAAELDGLEHVQPRIDSWLRVAAAAVSDDPGPEPFGEGPA